MNADEREQLAKAITAKGYKLTVDRHGYSVLIGRGLTLNRQPGTAENDFLLAAGDFAGAHIESP
jgi:hypothetical protein